MRALALALAIELVSLALPGSSPAAPDGTWSTRFGVEPPWTAVIRDPIRNRLVAFASLDGANERKNRVWVLPLDGSSGWSPLATTNDPPTARFGYSVIYDPVGDRLILFGGFFTVVNTIYSAADCWALTLGPAPTWSQLPLGPGSRHHHSAIYDPLRRRMILFGGYTIPADASLNDAWALDLNGSPVWKQLVEVNPPSARYLHSATFDKNRREMIVLGGYSSSSGSYFDETWKAAVAAVGDSLVWTKLTPSGTGPGPRRGMATAYDQAGDRVLVYGGESGIGAPTTNLLALHLGPSPSWEDVTPPGGPPPPGVAPGLVFDDVSRILFYAASEVWKVDLSAPVWTLLAGAVTPSPVPSSRRDAAVGCDPTRHLLFMFGGKTMTAQRFNCPPHGTASNYTLAYFDELWSYSFGQPTPFWTKTPFTGPSRRARAALVYDNARDRLVLYGGYFSNHTACATSVTETIYNDTWEYQIASQTWSPLSPAGPIPSPRKVGFATYDAPRDRMIVFGGANDDVWALNFSGAPTWTPIATLDRPLPNNALFYRSGAPDVARNRVLFPGLTDSSDVWSFDLTTGRWSILQTIGTPPPGPVASTGRISSVADPLGDRILAIEPAGSDRGATWELSLGAPSMWRRLSTVGTLPLVPQYEPAVGFDPVGSELAQFGGGESNNDDVATHNDLWALSVDRPTVPVLGSLISATTTADGPELVWQVSASSGPARVERRTETQMWSPRTSLWPDASGLVTYLDHDFEAGRRYGYRLVVNTSDGEALVGEAWVSAPEPSIFALFGAVPDPAMNGVRVVFSLADGEPARVDLLDARGHRVRSLAIPTGGGRRSLDLARPGEMEAGVYFLKLTQGARQSTRKFVLLH